MSNYKIMRILCKLYTTWLGLLTGFHNFSTQNFREILCLIGNIREISRSKHLSVSAVLKQPQEKGDLSGTYENVIFTVSGGVWCRMRAAVL